VSWVCPECGAVSTSAEVEEQAADAGLKPEEPVEVMCGMDDVLMEWVGEQ